MRIHAEFLAHVHGQRLVRVPGDLRGDLPGQVGVHAASAERRGQLPLLGDRVGLQLDPLLATSEPTSSFCDETDTNSPAAMEQAPAARPARPVRITMCGLTRPRPRRRSARRW